MKIYRYENSLEDIVNDTSATIFLAGPSVRHEQKNIISWRFDAIEEFEKQNFCGSLLIPEFTSSFFDDYKEWLPKWEFAGLSACDVIMFWIPRTKELIGLTTNHEIGYWMGRRREKVVYGRPTDSYRNRYLDLMWQADAEQNNKNLLPISNTLKDTISNSIKLASKNIGKFRIKSKIKIND